MSDDLRDEDVIAYLEIKVRRSGAMSVAGCINDYAYALAMMDQAKQTIKDHHRRADGGMSQIIVPAHDNALAH